MHSTAVKVHGSTRAHRHTSRIPPPKRSVHGRQSIATTENAIWISTTVNGRPLFLITSLLTMSIEHEQTMNSSTLAKTTPSRATTSPMRFCAALVAPSLVRSELASLGAGAFSSGLLVEPPISDRTTTPAFHGRRVVTRPSS